MLRGRPIAIDLFCGLGGWTEALLAEGYYVVGFDVEHHVYGADRYPGQLVIQDVLTLDGRQFRDAALIVASPPCTEYSYMAMPWSRAKRIAAALRGDGEFPEGYKGSRTVPQLTALFDACFRIQREASEAAGHRIPLVVENVKGAQPWVGRAAWNFGSFYLWGDVPALMPMTKAIAKVPGLANGRFPPGGLAQGAIDGVKHGGDCFNDPRWPGKQGGVKQPGIAGTRANGKGDRWFQDGAARHGSKSSARKAAAARIAKIPYPLAQHVARCYALESAP